jgi:hypothetical protein
MVEGGNSKLPSAGRGLLNPYARGLIDMSRILATSTDRECDPRSSVKGEGWHGKLCLWGRESHCNRTLA